jgi:hypothetical protein
MVDADMENAKRESHLNNYSPVSVNLRQAATV